jgi:hypothetical protein
MSKGSKQPAATTQTTTTEFPSELRPYITDILERSKARAEAEEKAGYQPYTAPRIAGFEPEQLAAQQATKDIVSRGVSADPMLSSAQTYYAPAFGLTLGQAERFGAPQAAQYMSPYQQAVIDVEKREAARSFAPQMQQIGAQAVGAGGFGGSRQAILESEALRNQQQMLGDIQTRGTQQAYDRAQAAFEAQKARERGAAGSLAQMGAAIPGQAFKEIGALEAVGAGRRADAQRALDLGYSQFQEEQLFPTRTLQEYQSIVRGFPYTPNTYTSGFTTSPPASLAQNVLGIGTGIAGLAGAFGGFGAAKEGGHLAKLAQGRRSKDADSETPIQDAYEEGGDDEDSGSKLFDLEQLKRALLYPAEILGADVPRDAPGVPTGTIFGTDSNVADVDEMPLSEGLPIMLDEAGQQLKRAAMYPAEPILGAPKDAPGSPIITVGDAVRGTLMMPTTDEQIEKKLNKANADKKDGASVTSTAQAAEADAKSQDGTTTATDTNTDLDLNLSKDVTKKDMKSGITELNDLLAKVKERTTLTPEMLAYKNELKSLRADLGKRESQKKEDLKKQKYLQLAQFGLNVLSADTSKGDLQIIGEAGKEPLSALGAITAKEAELGDETSAAKLEMLGKEAGVAEAEQTAERQKLTDSLAVRKAITDEVSNKIKLGEYGSGIDVLSPSETSQLRQDIFGEYAPKMADPKDTSSLLDAESRASAKWSKILDQNYELRNNPAKANALLKQLTADEYRNLITSKKVNITPTLSAADASNKNKTANTDDAYQQYAPAD